MVLTRDRILNQLCQSRKRIDAFREARLLAEKIRRQLAESLEKIEGSDRLTEVDSFRFLVGKNLLKRRFELMTVKTLLFSEAFDRPGEAEKALALLKEVLRQSEAEAAEELSDLRGEKEALNVGAEAALATLRVIRSYLEPILDPMPKERFVKYLRKAASELSRKREAASL